MLPAAPRVQGGPVTSVKALCPLLSSAPPGEPLRLLKPGCFMAPGAATRTRGRTHPTPGLPPLAWSPSRGSASTQPLHFNPTAPGHPSLDQVTHRDPALHPTSLAHPSRLPRPQLQAPTPAYPRPYLHPLALRLQQQHRARVGLGEQVAVQQVPAARPQFHLRGAGRRHPPRAAAAGALSPRSCSTSRALGPAWAHRGAAVRRSAPRPVRGNDGLARRGRASLPARQPGAGTRGSRSSHGTGTAGGCQRVRQRRGAVEGQGLSRAGPRGGPGAWGRSGR